MPELPEVETVKKVLESKLINRQIITVDVFHNNIISTNLEDFKKNIINQKIKSFSRKGKLLIFYLDNYVMTVHLRMEGKFYIKKSDEIIDKHEHVIFHLDDNQDLRYHDTRKFGKIGLYSYSSYELKSPLSKIADEPFTINKKYFYQRISKLKKPIKSILLDQSIISGIGNIYADEVLFLSKIHPLRTGNTISENESNSIIDNSIKVLNKAISLGGTTIYSYTSSLGISGLFQNELLVHTRANEKCFICGTIIEKIVVGGRGTYVCPKCQK